MATVTKIPAKLDNQSKSLSVPRKRKVAAYARVSTDHEEQETSYDAQVKYYTEFIKSHAEWEFVGVYTDEGRTGTTTKRRDGFNRMVEDALAGKIDLIINKSISRFARNTVDSLTVIRQLKERGTEVYFEKENIWTFDAKGEVLITIMSSLAQEESRSISENVLWGKRKQFAEGKISVNYKHFLGYDKGPNGEFVVNKEQAEIVKLIYRLYLSGLSPTQICKEMMRRGIKSPSGKPRWHFGTVTSILSNEKYKGDALIQKYYTKDFLTHKQLKNNGELPQYYVKDHHEKIIDEEVFDMVQAEMERRAKDGMKYNFGGVFTKMIKCGDCGGWYGAKTWHANSIYEKRVFQCNRKYENEVKCTTPHVTEEEIKEKFIKVINELIDNREELIENTKVMMEIACDCTEERQKKDTLSDTLESLEGRMGALIDENSRTVMDQDRYKEAYAELEDEYDRIKAETDKLSAKIADSLRRRAGFEALITILETKQEFIEEFDESVWRGLVDHITVYSKEDIRITFKDGREIKA